MAKKKTQKQSGPISSEKFLKEKANKLPIYSCKISKDYKETGEALVSIARERGNGKLCVGNFLVDLFCLGVKDVFGNVNMEKEQYDSFLVRNGDNLEDCDYILAHNIILGAVEFAEEADIEPAAPFRIWQYLLSEDDDSIPLMEIDYGYKGKHFLFADAGSPEAKLIPKLKAKLGDNFDYSLDVDFKEEEESDYLVEDRKNFHYDYPEYPSTLSLKYPRIESIIYDPENEGYLSKDELDYILSLPKDEAGEDIHNLILNEIGRTYPLIQADKDYVPDNEAILISLLLLAVMESEYAFKASMEIMRQSTDFIFSHLDIECGEYLIAALVALPPTDSQIEEMRKFLNEKGHSNNGYSSIIEGIGQAVVKYPEKENILMPLLEEFLERMPERLEEGGWFTYDTPGLLTATLLDLGADRLLPAIERMYATGKVDDTIAGDIDDVRAEFTTPTFPRTQKVVTKETLMKYLVK